MAAAAAAALAAQRVVRGQRREGRICLRVVRRVMVLMLLVVGQVMMVIRHSELVVLDLKLLHDSGRYHSAATGRGRRARELRRERGRRRWRRWRPGGLLKGAARARARRRWRPAAAAIHGWEGEVNVGGPLVHRSL